MRAVITGAAGSIGHACVQAFRNLGAEVVGVDVVPSAADEHHLIDLAGPDCGRELAAALSGRGVDVLVNNAAVGHGKDALSTGVAEFDAVVAVNLRAPFLLSCALHPNLSMNGGAIINVSSVHALATSSPVSVYAATKGGLQALTRALALEWAPDVTVNAVLPGAVDSPMLDDGLRRAGKNLAAFEAAVPVGRVGQPGEIADAVVFLATNRYVTGASLVVDGGATARLSTE